MPEFVCFVWSLPRQCCPFPGIGPEAKSNPATLRINYGIIPKMVFIPIGLRNQKWDKYHFSGAHATVFLARIKTPLGGRPGRREPPGNELQTISIRKLTIFVSRSDRHFGQKKWGGSYLEGRPWLPGPRVAKKLTWSRSWPRFWPTSIYHLWPEK